MLIVLKEIPLNNSLSLGRTFRSCTMFMIISVMVEGYAAFALVRPVFLMFALRLPCISTHFRVHSGGHLLHRIE